MYGGNVHGTQTDMQSSNLKTLLHINEINKYIHI